LKKVLGLANAAYWSTVLNFNLVLSWKTTWLGHQEYPGADAMFKFQSDI